MYYYFYYYYYLNVEYHGVLSTLFRLVNSYQGFGRYCLLHLQRSAVTDKFCFKVAN
jgi:hypothetical protein